MTSPLLFAFFAIPEPLAALCSRRTRQISPLSDRLNAYRQSAGSISARPNICQRRRSEPLGSIVRPPAGWGRQGLLNAPFGDVLHLVLAGHFVEREEPGRRRFTLRGVFTSSAARDEPPRVPSGSRAAAPPPDR